MNTNAENVRTVKELVELCVRGTRPEYLFFWGHTPKSSSADKSCLSNWFSSKFSVGDESFPTTEHYMMAEKARLFNDTENLAQIIVSKSPGEAKKLGRLVNGFEENIWLEHRFSIVVKGNFYKFSQNDELKAFLLSTGTKVIVEASPRDRIWGIGMGQNNPSAGSPTAWKGLNLLGFALMEVRKRLRDQIE